METYVYLDGAFWDRVADTLEVVARSLGARIERCEEVVDPATGPALVAYLVSAPEPDPPVPAALPAPDTRRYPASTHPAGGAWDDDPTEHRDEDGTWAA